VSRNGLASQTFFYPGILLRQEYEALPPHAGTLGKSVERLRSAIRIALGIGQGSCTSAGAAAGSRRGRIVELQPDLAHNLQTRHAVVLTDYSRARHYDVILPLLRGDGRVGTDDVFRVWQREWFAAFPDPPRSVLLPIPVVQSTWFRADIVRESPYVVDEQTLADIDRALCRFFALSDH
jgi:hypothetical protein